ncbi:MAG: nucleotidyltransferase domain-containing protein [Bacteroidales bacterium]|nr:nucleotidyltransferase domain-containing protein [Bacteroidales bacterium]MBR1894872.1 nucleotidyltransferase domain-containing protein [Bacteroidales bacterium]
MISQVQRMLASLPVTKAWVFGSFARGEETPESDLDLLVDYDKTVGISLLDVVRYKLDLENAIGRDVDLIENGSLKPFAAPSAEREKYLVYER